MMATKPKIAVLGGGFAGLESLFYLKHKLNDRADLVLVTDEPKFLFKPNTIYIPFGESPERFELDLQRPLARQGIELVHTRVENIDPQRRSVALATGELNYDYLVVATGAKMRSQEIPGLCEHAITVWTTDEMMRLRDRIDWAKERARANTRTRFLFLVPPNNKCSGPLYEMVMMLDSHLRKTGCRACVDLTFATKEEAFIEAFGPRLNTVVTEEFRSRDIEGHTGFVVTAIERNTAIFQGGNSLSFDVLVSFPPYVASSLFEQLPIDNRGFIKVDGDSRRVTGQDRVFAAGDAANFPIKQAFLALLQGDAAGDHIAAEVLGRKPEVDFEPMSMCVMEQLNKATFAQVPLKYTGEPNKPVAVDVADTEHYKVGVSPLWRVGKAVLGYYLPWRFDHGKPFHAGFAWDVMDFGLKIMSKTLAT